MTTFSQADHVYMQRAISLAKQGHYTTTPNPRVGCVLVNNGDVVGEGYHRKAGTGHAEVNAIKDAGNKAKGATAYVTLEPCSHYGRTPPCAEGLIKAGVTHVIAAMVDPDPRVSGRGLSMLEEAGISTQVGLLNTQARALNLGFITLMTTKLPYVRCKLAASLDGKTAMANGESKWITSAESRRDVQRLRAQSCAIITGADSVLIDNAKMTVRWSELGQLNQQYTEQELRQPVRVVIDSRNRLLPELPIFEHESPVIIITGKIDESMQWPSFVELVELPTVITANGDTKIDLKAVLVELANRGLNDVMLESGSNLAGAFIEQDLVDELVLYQAPKLMGADGLSLAKMPALTRLSSAKNLTVIDVRMVGVDIKTTAKFI